MERPQAPPGIEAGHKEFLRRQGTSAKLRLNSGARPTFYTVHHLPTLSMEVTMDYYESAAWFLLGVGACILIIALILSALYIFNILRPRCSCSCCSSGSDPRSPSGRDRDPQDIELRTLRRINYGGRGHDGRPPSYQSQI
jgi:hypothetical protein